MFDISNFAQGLALGLGMFVCPGPKDIVVFRQALCKRPPLELVAVGALSDAFLIALGIVGASAALSQAPRWHEAALWLGVAFVVAHGVQAVWRAKRSGDKLPALTAKPDRQASGGTVGLLAESFLNPVAWLDTVIVIGAVGAAQAPGARLAFGAGAVLASLAWFSALVVGARRAARHVSGPRFWRALDALVALAMFGMAFLVARNLI